MRFLTPPRLPAARLLVVTALVTGGLAMPAAASDDAMNRGGQLIAEESWAACQALFEEALEADSTNVSYRAQLGLCLAEQKEHEAAERQLAIVLAAEPSNLNALWYRSYNRYLAGDYRGAIREFEELMPTMMEGLPQEGALSWFVGAAYRELLQTEGLTFAETDAMVAAFDRFLANPSTANVGENLREWLAWVQQSRPEESEAEKWKAVVPAAVLEASLSPTEVYGEILERVELPDPAPGFVWKKLLEFGLAFQMPEAWHFRQDAHGDTIAFFISRENIDELGYFRTGLSVNVIRNTKERTGRSAVEFAKAFAAGACQDGKKLEAWQRQTGVLHAATCTVARVPENVPIVLHHLAIGNERTDTTFIMWFETFAESWEEDWSNFGSPMMDYFVIDDEV